MNRNKKLHIIGILVCVFSLTSMNCIAQNKSQSKIRQKNNFNREWQFSIGDFTNAPEITYDDHPWQKVHLPHSFSIPYFMWSDVYNGYGWYRKIFEMPSEWQGKQISIEFEGIFIQSEIYLNGQRIGEHVGGYTGFCINITPHLRKGKNVLAIRVNNLWKANVAPRAGDHQFSGGIYRDVFLHVNNPLHVTWNGVVISTSSVTRQSATFLAETEVINNKSTPEQFVLSTEIISPEGKIVSKTETKEQLAPNSMHTYAQTPNPVVNPQLWHPDTPVLYTAVTTIKQGNKVIDRIENPFGIRWFEWTADKGLFLNGEHFYILGANVHQDHAGWGDAVTNAGFYRDVKMMKECGFNSIRGSHYPHDPSFAKACDEIGMLFFPENVFWGMGGGSGDRDGWGMPSSSCYPPDPADQNAFDESVLQQLQELIRINRNSPSIIAWSLSNEPFFTDVSTNDRMKALLNHATDSVHVWDPARLVAIGGCQRKGVDKLGKNQVAFYNGDGASFPAPGVPNMVSEYSSVSTHRPGQFLPGWGDLVDGFKRPQWRGGQVIWCGFDHGTVGGTGLATMGIVDYFRLPKRAWYWYREVYARGNTNPQEPQWSQQGTPASIRLTADKTTLATPDGTDDAHITIALLDASGKQVSNEIPVKLTVKSGPGEFPTGPSIVFMPPSDMEASDITIRDGMAAIEFRSYYAGTSVIEATADGLPPTSVTIKTLGFPTWESAGKPVTVTRPYHRYHAPAKAKTTIANEMLLAVNRPSTVSSTAELSNKSLANDDDEQTAWFANTSDKEAYWMLDMEASYQQDAIQLVFPTTDVYRYIIEVSADQQQWNTVIDQKENDSKEKIQTFKGNFGNNVRFVCIRFFSPNAGLSEVRIGGRPF